MNQEIENGEQRINRNIKAYLISTLAMKLRTLNIMRFVTSSPAIRKFQHQNNSWHKSQACKMDFSVEDISLFSLQHICTFKNRVYTI